MPKRPSKKARRLEEIELGVADRTVERIQVSAALNTWLASSLAYEVKHEGKGQESQRDETEKGSAPVDLEVHVQTVRDQRHSGTECTPDEIVLERCVTAGVSTSVTVQSNRNQTHRCQNTGRIGRVRVGQVVDDRVEQERGSNTEESGRNDRSHPVSPSASPCEPAYQTGVNA